MTSKADHGHSMDVAARVERRWATLSVGIIVLLAGRAAFAGTHQATMRRGGGETATPPPLLFPGDSIKTNPGGAAEPAGWVPGRAVGQKSSFPPQCMLVPADTPVT